MAIEPIGAPQPVKLAIAPLAAAQEVVRLTQEQNQRIRESRLEVDSEAARQARQAADAARAAAREEARRENNSQAATDTADSRPQPAVAPPADVRGETVDILA